jgi:hypothetical protein
VKNLYLSYGRYVKQERMVERARKWVDLIKRSDDDDDKIMNIFEITRLLNGFTTRANDKKRQITSNIIVASRNT